MAVSTIASRSTRRVILCTVIIPVANYHRDSFQDALTSVEQQTVPTETIVIHDEHNRGAGWARNQGARKVSTPFVCFLDADDILAPTFVEQTAQHYRQGRFVYTDWIRHDGERINLPDCTEQPGWQAGEIIQLVTTLLPTELYQAADGFDEQLPTGEDFDFYMKIRALGSCGIRCPQPLVTYRRDRGRRGNAGLNGGQYAWVFDEIARRYGRAINMGCCGGDAAQAGVNGTYQQGDVQVVALWNGNATMHGPVTGRKYRSGNRKRFWMSPEDAQAPGYGRFKWEPVQEQVQLGPDHDLIRRLIGVE